MTPDETSIRSIELLRPQAGDVILVTLPDSASEKQRQAFAQAFYRACGDQVRVAVLPASVGVKVIRVADIPAEAYPGPGFEQHQQPPSLDMGTQLVL